MLPACVASFHCQAIPCALCISDTGGLMEVSPHAFLFRRGCHHQVRHSLTLGPRTFVIGMREATVEPEDGLCGGHQIRDLPSG